MGKAAEHLSISELESILHSCVTVKSKSGNEFIFPCLFHDDKNPSASYNSDKDVFHCFNPNCGVSGDIITLWGKAKGSGDAKENFKAFCEEYNISDGFNTFQVKKEKKKEIPHLDDIYQMLGPLPDIWIEKLISTRGWHPLAIKELGIMQQTHYQAKKTGAILPIKKPERIAIPIYDTAGHVRNIRLYKPWGRKPNQPKIISWGADYGAARLFPATPRKDGIVLLCEGESDTICAISNRFNAITQTSKPKKWKKDHLKQFKGRDVVIAFDADQPGQMYAQKYAAPQISKVAKSVSILQWPDFMGRF